MSHSIRQRLHWKLDMPVFLYKSGRNCEPGARNVGKFITFLKTDTTTNDEDDAADLRPGDVYCCLRDIHAKFWGWGMLRSGSLHISLKRTASDSSAATALYYRASSASNDLRQATTPRAQPPQATVTVSEPNTNATLCKRNWMRMRERRRP